MPWPSSELRLQTALATLRYRHVWANRLFHMKESPNYEKMVKANRSGQAATQTPEQLDQIIAGCSPKFAAVLSVCRFTACRITESLSLRWENIMPDTLVFPRLITKKKMATREIPISPKLAQALQQWKSQWPSVYGRDYEKTDWVFPAPRDVTKHLGRPRVDEALRASCRKAGIEGVSTHSFRRSALTQASTAGVPLRHIQALSGHSSLEQLQRYLDVSENQKKQAAMAFG